MLKYCNMFRKIKKDIKNKFIFKQFSHQRKTQNAYFKKNVYYSLKSYCDINMTFPCFYFYPNTTFLIT